MEKDNLKDNLKKELSEVKDFLSDWSQRKIRERKIGETLFDEEFRIEDMPLSWFYRPILYSNLLPPPFVTVDDFLSGIKKNRLKIKLSRALFQKYLAQIDNMKSFCTKKKMVPSKKEKIFFLTFTTMSFREQKIIEMINNDGKYEVFRLGVDPLTAFSPAKIRRMEHTLYGYYDQEIRMKARTDSKELARKWNRINDIIKATMLQYKGKDLYSYYKENLNFLYSQQFIFLVSKYYYTFCKILQEENINGIVVGSQNNIIEKCLIAAAWKRNLPVFIIQHGIGLGTYPTIDTPKNVKFAVFSEKYKNELMGLGIPDRKSVV